MSLSVVIPWRGGCPWRERALAFVRERYEGEVIVAEAPPGEWNKPAAVMAGIAEAQGEIVLVADADVFSDGIAEAVAAVESGRCRWARPFRRVFRLTPEATEAVLDGADPRGLPTAERNYLGIEGGGLVVVEREAALEVPMDPRFVGWGGEDIAWGIALRCLTGKPWRAPGRWREPLWHLWHPPQIPRDRIVLSAPNERLYRRYCGARLSQERMRDLIEEIGNGTTEEIAEADRQAA